MRLARVILLIQIVASSVVAPLALAEGSTDDWFLLVLTAGPEGAADVSLRGGWTAIAGGPEQRTAGTVTRYRGRTYGELISYGGAAKTVGIATPWGAVSETVVSEGGGSIYQDWGATITHMDPGEVVASVDLVTGFTFAEASAEVVSVDQGNVTLTTYRGSGSQVVSIVEGDSVGAGVQADNLALGDVRLQRHPTEGIVGAFPARCTYCEHSWTAPDDRFGSGVVSTPCAGFVLTICFGLLGPTDGFAGPGGPWSWSWRGLNTGIYDGASVITAYAPVGDLWTLFA